MNASENNISSQPENNERQSANWDLRYAVRNYSTLVVTQIISAFFSFASVWIATRYLGTEGYGGIVAVIAASQVAQIFVNWTCVSLARYGVQEFVEAGNISKSFWARTLIFLPNTIIFFALSFLWLPILSKWLKLPPEAAWFVAAHFLAAAVWAHIQHAIQGAKLPRLQGILLAIERFLIFSILLILALSGTINYLSAIAAYIFAPLLMALIGLFQIHKFVSWRINFDWNWAKKMLKFSIPLIPFSLIGYFSTNYLDAIFISQYLSKADLGIYSVAYQFNGILMQFPTLAGSLLLPLFVTLQTTQNIEKVKLYMEDILPLLTLAGGLFGICTAVLMKIFIPLVFGAELNQSVIVFWILVSSTAFVIPGVIGYAPYLNSFSATYVATIMAIVAAVVNFAANFLLIPRYGLKGCAWATVLAYGASTLVVIFITNRWFSLKHKWTLPAALPALVGSAYASWTENLLMAFLLAFLTAFGIVLVYRKSFVEAFRLLINYRRLVGKESSS
ncbi:polysaccharide biosynthesis C-terminal domain-containing protein [soil metagenome]